MQIPPFDEIIEPNDQTRARQEHLEKLASWWEMFTQIDLSAAA